MESNKNIILLGIGIILLLAIGIIFLTQQQKTMDPLTVLNATKKLQNLDNYAMITVGRLEINVTKGAGLNGTIDSIVRVYRNKDLYRVDTIVILKEGIVESRAYYIGNQSYLCALSSDWACVRAETGNESKEVAESLKKRVFDTTAFLQANERMLAEGSLVLTGPALEKTIENKNCYQVEGMLDIKRLSQANRNLIELPDDSKVYYSKQCIDQDSGVTVSSYSYIARENTTIAVTTLLTGINVTNLSTTIFELPSEPTTVYGAGICSGKNRTALDKCFREEAYNRVDYRLCYDVINTGSRDDCFFILLPESHDISLCSRIDSPSLRDDCYVEAGGITKDLKTCNSIINTTLRETCLGIISNSTMVSNNTG